MILEKIQTVLSSEGLHGFSRILGEKVSGRSIRSFRLCKHFFKDLIGLEVGGPSALFAPRRLFPVYSVACRIDNVTFSGNTLWQSSVSAGPTFLYNKHRPAGNQYFSEATDLSAFTSETFAFVLSSHVIEHLANPIAALFEWIRVLKVRGILVLVVPHKEGTFDHRRPVTTFEHLKSDFAERMPESDLTHVPEVLRLHDLKRDPFAGGTSFFEQRTTDNPRTRGMHHHVFDAALVGQLLDFVNLQFIAIEAVKPHHIFAIAQKLPAGEKANNAAFLLPNAPHRLASPFLLDRP